MAKETLQQGAATATQNPQAQNAPASGKKEKPEPTPQQKEAFARLHAGNERYHAGDIEDAIAEFKKAAELDPELGHARFNLGVIYRDREEYELAKPYFESLCDEKNHRSQAHNNLGIIEGNYENFEAAEKHYRKAIEIAFQFPLAHFNLGMLLLRMGRFEEGWRECEWRWQTPGFNPIRCVQPRWTGQEVDTLLVHTEQGAGDTFQFCRFMPRIRERCKKVIFFCPDPLLCMFRGGEWGDDVRAPGQLDHGAFQNYLPLMSAPYALGLNDEDSIRVDVPYLTPERRDVKLGECHVPNAKLKVAVVWGGSVTHKNDAHRSIALQKLGPLFEIPEIAFYSIQKGPQVDDIKKLSSAHGQVFRDVDDLQKDFADTAAIMEQMDLTICVDTSVVHLAGGLGKPAWCLLSANNDWRWMRDREDSPWYPSVRLFRQRKIDVWEDVVADVAGALRGVLGGSQSILPFN